MVEIIDNIIQLIITGTCTVAAMWKAVRTYRREWFLFSLFTGIFFLGDLFWELYIVFYSRTPFYSFIPNLSWCTAYLFLLLMLLHIKEKKRGGTTRHS